MDCQEEKRDAQVFSPEWGGSSLAFNPKQPKFYKWTPQQDITTFELATCIPVFNVRELGHLETMVESLPENSRRHFTEVQ